MLCENETGAVIRCPSRSNLGCTSTGSANRSRAVFHHFGRCPSRAARKSIMNSVSSRSHGASTGASPSSTASIAPSARAFDKSGKRPIEIHPVDTRRRDDQSVRRIEGSIFDLRANPSDLFTGGLGTITRQTKHCLRGIDSIGAIDPIDQAECNLSSPAPGVQQDSRLIAHQLEQRLINFGRVRRTKDIVLRHSLFGEPTPARTADWSLPRSLFQIEFENHPSRDHCYAAADAQIQPEIFPG